MRYHLVHIHKDPSKCQQQQLKSETQDNNTTKNNSSTATMVFKSKFKDVIPAEKYKNSLSLFYWHQLDVYANRTLFVDFVSGRQWTGAEIKQKATSIAQYLIEEVGLKPHQSSVFFYPQDDKIQIISLAVLFAGASVCVGSPFDPAAEHCHMLKVVQPSVVFVESKLHQEMIELRDENKFNYKICIIDDHNRVNKSAPAAASKPENSSVSVSNDDVDEITYELHDVIQLEANLETPPRDSSSSSSSNQGSTESPSSSSSSSSSLPILVDPDEAAYVLLTSGSTGRPKPVARSHRNSLYVCHSLSDEVTNQLWDLNENSVLSGHLQLDHGTGTFCTKMTLAKGLKLILMDGYHLETMLKAIERYQISDILLGSALLHNFISTPKSVLDKYTNFSSLKNFLSVGSRLPSHKLAQEFMSTYPQVSIRQTFGMTEVGFTCIMERSRAKDDNETVGLLLPYLCAKLLDLETGHEIDEPNRDGELLLAGPTISPGYLTYDSHEEADKLRQQAEKVFLPDGYYRSFDVGSFTADGRLKVCGRFNDILCLHDGWKVLPQEIETLLIEHPAIQEAAVVGIPHPELNTCHAPRAYVTLKEAWRNKITERQVFQWAADRTSEPKHLIGGVRFMDSLPRARLSKIDRRALLKMDGFN